MRGSGEILRMRMHIRHNQVFYLTCGGEKTRNDGYKIKCFCLIIRVFMIAIHHWQMNI